MFCFEVKTFLHSDHKKIIINFKSCRIFNLVRNFKKGNLNNIAKIKQTVSKIKKKIKLSSLSNLGKQFLYVQKIVNILIS